LVADPKNVALAQQVADDAVTLVRDNGKLLPLHPVPRGGTNSSALPYTSGERTSGRLVALIFTDDVRSDWGRQFELQLRHRVPDADVIYVDPDLAPFLASDIAQKVARAQSVVAAVYAVPSAGKAINDPTAVLGSVLQNAAEKTVVIAMGSPYVATGLPQVQNYLCTFSNSVPSENSAVRALFGEIPIRGRLPVSIPGIAQRGTGIERPARVVQGGLKRHGEKTGNANP
jgi:beta-N-acetylhexosaminidase